MSFEDDVTARLASLEFNNNQLGGRVRLLEKMLDTKATPLWRRIWFRIDGWPAWYHVAERRQWRPWHGD